MGIICNPGVTYGPKIVTDGLVLHLDAANKKSYPGSGTTWKDLSGKNNDAQIYNGATYSSDLKSFVFDGVNDYAYVPYTNTDLDGDPLFTVEAVIRRTSDFGGKGYWGIAGDAVFKGINSYTYTGLNNKIGLDLWGAVTFNCGIDYPLNTFVHVVWVKYATLFSSNSFYIYVNGVQYGSSSFVFQRGSSATPSLDTSASNKGIVLGRIGSNTANYNAPGGIQLFKVYSSALSDIQVKQNFEATRGRYGV